MPSKPSPAFADVGPALGRGDDDRVRTHAFDERRYGRAVANVESDGIALHAAMRRGHDTPAGARAEFVNECAPEQAGCA